MIRINSYGNSGRDSNDFKIVFFFFNIQFECTDISLDAIVDGPVKPVLNTIVFTYKNRNIGLSVGSCPESSNKTSPVDRRRLSSYSQTCQIFYTGHRRRSFLSLPCHSPPPFHYPLYPFHLFLLKNDNCSTIWVKNLFLFKIISRNTAVWEILNFVRVFSECVRSWSNVYGVLFIGTAARAPHLSVSTPVNYYYYYHCYYYNYGWRQRSRVEEKNQQLVNEKGRKREKKNKT